MDPTMVSIEQIIADPELWPRDRLDRDRVDDFRELYAGDGPSILPPLAVIEVENGYLLADGWHRLAALSELECSSVPVVLLNTGGMDGRRAAYEEGLRSCAASSKPLVKAERHAAILRLTVEGGRTDREIARLVGVSHQTVARVRSSSGAGLVVHETGDPAVVVAATTVELSRRLIRGIRRLWDERGVTDVIAARLPRNLADALVAEFGEDEALTWARRLAAWSDQALRELGRHD